MESYLYGYYSLNGIGGPGTIMGRDRMKDEAEQYPVHSG